MPTKKKAKSWMSSHEAVDNSDLEGKQMIREWLLHELGGAANCKVLELFGGEGHVHDACYTQVKEHMAFDVRPSDRPTWLRGDNRMLLKTRVNGWDLYDLDAYVSPWLLAHDIVRLREPGVFGMALTCGIMRSLRLGNVGGFIKHSINLNGMAYGVGLLVRWHQEVVRWLMIDWEKHGVKVLEARRIRSANSSECEYFGVIVKKG